MENGLRITCDDKTARPWILANTDIGSMYERQVLVEYRNPRSVYVVAMNTFSIAVRIYTAKCEMEFQHFTISSAAVQAATMAKKPSRSARKNPNTMMHVDHDASTCSVMDAECTRVYPFTTVNFPEWRKLFNVDGHANHALKSVVFDPVLFGNVTAAFGHGDITFLGGPDDHSPIVLVHTLGIGLIQPMWRGTEYTEPQRTLERVQTVLGSGKANDAQTKS